MGGLPKKGVSDIPLRNCCICGKVMNIQAHEYAGNYSTRKTCSSGTIHARSECFKEHKRRTDEARMAVHGRKYATRDHKSEYLFDADKNEKYRGPGEVFEAIPTRYPFPSKFELEEGKKEFLLLQKNMDTAFRYAGYKGMTKHPPCTKCNPKILYYCQQEAIECWSFITYTTGGDDDRLRTGED